MFSSEPSVSAAPPPLLAEGDCFAGRGADPLTPPSLGACFDLGLGFRRLQNLWEEVVGKGLEHEDLGLGPGTHPYSCSSSLPS